MKTKSALASFMFIAFTLIACSAINEKTTDTAAAIVGATPTPAGNCAYYSEYDTVTDCQTHTFANCDWETKSFPNGATGTCYKPVTGWESCASTSTDWIYTPWTVMCQVGATSQYQVARSSISCSSTVCACLNPQVVAITCTDGVDCPVSIPFSPGPAACP